MKNVKLLNWSAKILSVVMLMHGAGAQALTLNEYIDAVKGDSKAYKGSAEQAEGSGLLSREADLIFTPKLFGDAMVGEDGKPASLNVSDSVKVQKYQLGVSQQFSFGLQGKLYYEMQHTELVGVDPSLAALVTDAKYWDASPKIEFTMPLLGGGFGRTAVANEEAARNQNLAQKYTSENHALSVLVGAEAAYWKLSIWQDVIYIQERAQKSAQEILVYVSRKKRMNLGEDADVMQARALVEARTLEVQVSKNEAAEAQRAFNKFLNREAYAEVNGLDKVNYVSLESLQVPQQRPGSRPDVLATESQLAAAKAQSVIATERNRATLDVYGNYSLNGRDEELNEALKAAGKTERDTAFIGVRFTVPLNFSAAGDARAGALKASKAAELNRDYAYYAQEQDWINLTRNLTDARENLKLLTRIENAQKAKLDAERTRLRQGRTTTYQVLLFEQDYAQAALSRVKLAANILALQAQTKMYQASAEGGK